MDPASRYRTISRLEETAGVGLVRSGPQYRASDAAQHCDIDTAIAVACTSSTVKAGDRSGCGLGGRSHILVTRIRVRFLAAAAECRADRKQPQSSP